MTIERIWFTSTQNYFTVWEGWVTEITSEIEEVWNWDVNVARVWVHKEDWRIISLNIDDCLIVYK